MRILLILLLSFSIAQAETAGRFYDQHNNPRGRLEQIGSRTYILDQNGNRHGYYQQEGDRVVRYDNNGNRQRSFTPTK